MSTEDEASIAQELQSSQDKFAYILDALNQAFRKECRTLKRKKRVIPVKYQIPKAWFEDLMTLKEFRYAVEGKTMYAFSEVLPHYSSSVQEIRARENAVVRYVWRVNKPIPNLCGVEVQISPDNDVHVIVREEPRRHRVLKHGFTATGRYSR